MSISGSSCWVSYFPAQPKQSGVIVSDTMDRWGQWSEPAMHANRLPPGGVIRSHTGLHWLFRSLRCLCNVCKPGVYFSLENTEWLVFFLISCYSRFWRPQKYSILQVELQCSLTISILRLIQPGNEHSNLRSLLCPHWGIGQQQNISFIIQRIGFLISCKMPENGKKKWSYSPKWCPWMTSA